MNATRIAGILLIVVGLFGVFQGETSVPTDRQTVEIGPMEVTATEKETIAVPEILGAIALAGGAILLIASFRQGGTGE